MDNLKVVRELRDLAAIPQNRATIVRVRKQGLWWVTLFMNSKLDYKF